MTERREPGAPSGWTGRSRALGVVSEALPTPTGTPTPSAIPPKAAACVAAIHHAVDR